MKFQSNLKIVLTCSIGLICAPTFAHDVPVHRAITLNAEASEFDHSSAYVDFLNTVSSDRPRLGLVGATNSMILGSGEEDDSPNDKRNGGGGYRSLNHFYDPLDTTYGKGLSDLPPDIRGIAGKSSFTWASISNGLGYDFHTTVLGIRIFIGDNVGTSNIWSWQNARGYEWLGLTATNQIQRQTNLDNMFRAVGQVLHLLEDASQPQHVRNEQHLDKLGKSFWESPIEDYGIQKDSFGIPNYQNNPQWFVMPPNAIIGWPNWQAAGFTKLEDFWDRHLYSSEGAAALTAAENGGAQLGLAEWCNGNFIGDRHTYAEFFSPSSIKYYPNPSLKNTTQPHLNPYNLSGSVIDTTTLENGKQGQRVYISQTGDGVNIVHQSALDYLAVKHPPRINTPGMQVTLTIRDTNVLQEYHNLFIPKAVEYSAGLLDYFFRGTLSVGFLGTNNIYTFTNKNTSGEDFYKGTFSLVEEDASTNRHVIWQTNLSDIASGDILPSGSSANMTYSYPSGPAPTGTKFLVVYQGTIGQTNNGALDPVDANISIAVARPSVEQTIIYPDDYTTNHPTGATISTNLDSPDFGFVPSNFKVTINSATFDDEGSIGEVDSIGFGYPSMISNVEIDPSHVSTIGNRLSVNLIATDLFGPPMGYQNVSITWRAWLPGQ